MNKEVAVSFQLEEVYSEVPIQPFCILPQMETEFQYRVRPNLQYLPSLKCLVYLNDPQHVTFINYSNLNEHSLRINMINDDLTPSTFSLHPEKNLLALGILSQYYEYEHRIPAHIQFLKMPENPFQATVITSSQFVNPHLYECRIHKMKIFPDGSKLFVTYSREQEGSWCKIFTFPESCNDEGNNQSTRWSKERWSMPDNVQTVPCEEIDIFKQGFPTIDENVKKMEDEDLTEDEYFKIYNARYFSSNLDGGFFCLAISPDTTRILAGTNDGEIYVIDSTTLKVLHCKREYGYCKTVTGCHYNPLFGNEEFAVCNEMGVFDIWNITTLDDANEDANKVHHLQFPPGTSNCVYSPDGRFIALTSGKDFKTYIISSTSGNTLLTLQYPGEESQNDHHNTYFLASSLFYGNLCKVAAIHDDHKICLWKLPVIYSLKTLCLIFLNANIRYNDIKHLLLPELLKKSLKYLYV
ncbi:uncharacterized protein LOC114528275 [Dendronephthya gigantea]|uniref:uncharacterized protein LOC114528275 n=1 Tax=Dendronephthya gigantea TaxID=151771 RepID=UPI00106CC18F|nr:uncharacterized protein LOC114528275 [Dendronephthya gigantea]